MAFLLSNSIENNELRFLSYNCKNFNNLCKLDFLRECFESHDFMFLQEHWLYKSELYKLSVLGSNVNVIGTSGMEEEACRLGRPYGGCAILWKAQLNCKATEIVCKSNRLCALKVDMLNGIRILLLNVYMPCDTGCYDGNYELYREVANEMHQIILQHQQDYIVCGGDFNTSLSRDTPNARVFKNLVQQCGLGTYKELRDADVPYTYFCSQYNTTSVIDYLLLSNSLLDCVSTYNVIKNNLFSDHIPVSMVLHLNSRNLNTCEREFNCKVAWHKVSDHDCEVYRTLLDSLIDEIHIGEEVLRCSDTQCNLHQKDVTELYEKIVNALSSAADVLPKTGTSRDKSGKTTVPGWKEFVEPSRIESLYWHECWLQAGKPRHGTIAENMRIARAKYHKLVRQVQREKDSIVMNRIANSMISNKSRNMWAELKKIKGRNVSVASCIDGLSDNREISNVFKERYEAVFNDVPTLKEELNDVYSEIVNDVTHCTNFVDISVRDVKVTIAKLKRDKQGSEEERLSSNHFIYASEKLSVLLSILYKLMLVHGVAPPGMSAGTMVPIPKNRNVSLSDGNNYRSITLGSIICKIFDLIVLEKEGIKLDTSSLQFGYKEHSSTVHCTFTLLETISYYKSRGSNVYLTLLDATKAFDKVHYGKLFKLLIDRQVSPIILRLLFKMYVQQEMRVKWSGSLSDKFNVSNGVKQGGILSPILFAVYMDVLLCRLKNSGFGCNVGNKWVGSLAYADDIALLCPSKFGMQKMLDIVMSFAKEYCMSFNGKKSQFLIFSNKLYPEGSVTLKVDGTNLSNVSEAKYLGNIIHVGDENSMLRAAEAKFWKMFNIFMADFGKLHTFVKLKLFKQYCCDYYGSVLWSHKSKYFDKLCVAWRKAVRIMSNLPYQTHCYLLPLLMDTIPLEVNLEVRFLKFVKNLEIGNCNSIVKHIYMQCLICPFSLTGRKVREFCYKHNVIELPLFKFDERDWLAKRRDYISHTVKELIEIRDGFQHCLLEQAEIRDLLDWLCVS